MPAAAQDQTPTQAGQEYPVYRKCQSLKIGSWLCKIKLYYVHYKTYWYQNIVKIIVKSASLRFTASIHTCTYYELMSIYCAY